MSVDSSGNAYVTGYTTGGLDANTSSGWRDMFLTKYDMSGNKQWTKQLGTSGGDEGRGVSIDNSGGVYVAGATTGNLYGNSNAGQSDVFLTKYDTDGNMQWTKLLGTDDIDEGFGVSTDSSGNAYVTGYTYGSLDDNTSTGQSDIFLTKFNAAGNIQWTKQLGTSTWEEGLGVSVDVSGNAYVTGYTYGSLDSNSSAGFIDIFLTKYDTNGNKQWTRQLGTSNTNVGSDVSVDSDGNAYITGTTRGGLDGNITAGESDVFLTKYDTNGDIQWTKLLGTRER